MTKEGNKYLAVLHNRNKMVNAFASTGWVANDCPSHVSPLELLEGFPRTSYLA